MENFKKFKIEFEFDNSLNVFLNNLNNSFNNNQNNFCKICLAVYSIWSYCKCKGYYLKAKNNEYYNPYSLLAKFGFDKKAVSRFKNCYEKFITGSSDVDTNLKSEFLGFSSSKLFELLPLSNETIFHLIDTKKITCDMTVKEIRQVVKLVLNGGVVKDNVVVEAVDDINEEEIPKTFNIKTKYSFDYFKGLSKAQLLTIVWDYHNFINKNDKKGNV